MWCGSGRVNILFLISSAGGAGVVVAILLLDSECLDKGNNDCTEWKFDQVERLQNPHRNDPNAVQSTKDRDKVRETE